MIFTATEVTGVFLVDLEPIVDERGFFARAWCREEFRRHGLIADFVQANIAMSSRRGTVRGLHFVDPKFKEAKLVRCTRGAAFVVAADIRAGSPTHGHWVGVELSSENHRLLYVPPGCAQGYQTLDDQTEMFYQMAAIYEPGTTQGLRYDDPAFQICWPLPVTSISPADQSWPPYDANQSADAPLACSTESH
jgi:dTDP-4-dehydrorhamnose 3,5-epimerase